MKPIIGVALASALALAGCTQERDAQTAQQAQQMKAAQAAQAGQLKALQEETAALKTQMAQVQKNSEATLAAVEALAAKGASMEVSTPVPTVPAEPTEPAPEASVAKSEAQRVPPPNTMLRPGWIVEFVPMQYDGSAQLEERWTRGKVSAGSFISLPSGFGFLEHRRVVKAKNHVGFKASGYFVARDPGEYTFDLTLAQGKQDRGNLNGKEVGCDLDLTIDATVVIAQPVKVKSDSEISTQGMVSLSPGQHRAVLSASCGRFDYNWVEYSDLSKIESNMEKLQLRISARAPGRPNPVPLDEQDVVYDAIVRNN